MKSTPHYLPIFSTLFLPICTNPVTGPWGWGCRAHFVPARDSSSASKHEEPHKRLLVFYSLSGRVCCGRSFAFLLPAPPRLCINSVTGHVIGGRQSVGVEALHSLPTSDYPACTYHNILLRRVDGKAKPDEKTSGGLL